MATDAEPMVACDNCRTEIREGDSHSTSLGVLCDGCWEQTAFCEDCCEACWTDDLDRGRCPSCAENYHECADCEEIISRDETYCEACLDNYNSCPNCGELVHVDRSDDDGYCRDCAERISSRDYVIPESDRGERRFGIELETACCDDFRSLNNRTVFSSKRDGSIDGLEFVSPPMAGASGLAAIREFCRLANSLDFTVDKRCGFHLHIDLSDLSDEECYRVADAYRASEHIWRSFVSGSRRNNRYCGALRWDSLPCQAWRGNANPYSQSYCAWSGRQHRYAWVNVSAYDSHKTVEIRLHSATLDRAKVSNWVRVHLAFVNWALANHTIRDLEDETMIAWADWCNIIDDEALVDFYRERADLFGTYYPMPAHILG